MRSISLVAISLAGLLGGCGGSSSDGGEGSLSVGVTDAAVDGLTSVVVQFDGIELQQATGGRVSLALETPQSINLMQYQGGERFMLLDGVSIPAGTYQWMRLMVNADSDTASYVEDEAGGQHPLRIPSNYESGLKLNRGFTVADGGHSDFTIDFDLRRSVYANAGGYQMRPTLRLVDNLAVGHVSGTLPAAMVTEVADCEPAVYAYAGAGVTPDDVGSGTEPLTSAIPALDEATGDYRYAIGFLPAGDYTLAFTCQAGVDAPDADDDIAFAASVEVTVTANGAATADF